MTTELADHIHNIRMVDTHEHVVSERVYVDDGPDILMALFNNYVRTDLVVAGAAPQAVENITDQRMDLADRWNAIRDYWPHCQHTGYGEAVRIIAGEIYGIEGDITLDALQAAQAKNAELRQPGQRLHLLRDVANLDHVQIDNFETACTVDESGPDFFRYDLSWAAATNGYIGEREVDWLEAETGVRVRDLHTLRDAHTAIFDHYAPVAVAVKSQHAYNRPLVWVERDDADVAAVLHKALAGRDLSPDEQMCLGDWNLGQAAGLAAHHHLPVKIHTGILAHHAQQSRMRVERLNARHLAELFLRYPETRFVVMHMAYPFNDELVAIAKHFQNVYIDFCWGWSINPRAAVDFARKLIHAVPVNKVFGFGGDAFWPMAAVAYAIQARRWLARALQAEVDDGLLSEKQAIGVADRWLYANQHEVFDMTKA